MVHGLKEPLLTAVVNGAAGVLVLGLPEQQHS
jgi:hypothetical protein